ncbi:MAG: CPBP family intramembrane glutamic endopeptidase [Anaerolineae bacterium]
MKDLLAFVTAHPAWAALVATLAGLVLLLLLTGLSSAALRLPYGHPVPEVLGRALFAAGVLVLIWRMGGLDGAGIARPGGWVVWLVALAGTLYAGAAALQAFYGRLTPDLPRLLGLPRAGRALAVPIFVALAEELLFRGLVLWLLLRVWGGSLAGVLGSVVLSAVLFAVVHGMQVWTVGLPRAAAGYLVLQTLLMALWWGALVVYGGSLWPAVLAHAAVNALMALEGLAGPMAVPEVQGYRQLLLYSLLPGAAALLLLWRIPLPRP